MQRLAPLFAMTFLATTLLALPALAQPAPGQKILRIAMTAADIPTTTGLPNNGFEGMRFLGYPIFEGLVAWDLSRADQLAGLKPGLAERWEQDPADTRTWVFHLRDGVRFHDGSAFNADAVIWNLDRYYKTDSPQYEPIASAISRARSPLVTGYRKVDERTIAITTSRPVSYFPFMAVYLLFTSPASFEAAGRDWARVALLPAAGTGPFRITRFTPRQSVELARWDGYWDTGRRAKLDGVLLLPMPEVNTRVAALRSGQVDWIEVPPPDGIASLKQAGFNVVTNSYPHVWPWFFSIGASVSPFTDVRVRQALNYCVDRDGMVALLNGTAEPSVGWLKPKDPDFGSPTQRYKHDPARGRALLAEAGYGPGRPLAFKVQISPSGSGQMLPLPMNEFMQQTLKESCGVNVEFDVVEWNTLLTAGRLAPDNPGLHGTTALSISSPTSDASVMARYFSSTNFAPNGFNFSQWKDDRFDAAVAELETATDPAAVTAATRAAHERLVDNPPWLYIVHDLNPRAMSRRVQGFVSAQSWFQDLALVELK